MEDGGHAARDLVSRHLSSPASSWNIGGFGVLAEFHRDCGEPAELGAASVGTESAAGAVTQVITGRGAIRVRLEPDCRAIAYELLSARPDLWLHGVAFCLPQARGRMSRRTRITELGPDRDAARPADRQSVLFDLGLGLDNCDFCVRTADPGLLEVLRAAGGVPLVADPALLSELVRRSPHRVMVSRLGRIEVFQRIGAHGGTTPEGPHTHLLPGLMRAGRTHAANLPIPPGWLPCLSLYPPNPVQDDHGRRKPFDRAEHEAFQALLARHGEPEYVRAKALAMAALEAGRAPAQEASSTRVQRTAQRIALRQWPMAEAAAVARARPVSGATPAGIMRHPAP